MVSCYYLTGVVVVLSPVGGFAREGPDVPYPSFTTVAEVSAGFDLLYQQKFAEAREGSANWESGNPDQLLGEVTVAASYLFEELSRQGVLTSDFFLNEKKFLHGIDGSPDPERMRHFRDALARARELAAVRQKTNPKDAEALLALTLAAGMEADAESILQKRHLEGLKRMKKANGYAKQLLAQHPDATDAYIAPGIANYIIGSQSGGTPFAPRFGGSLGGTKVGIETECPPPGKSPHLRTTPKKCPALRGRAGKT